MLNKKSVVGAWAMVAFATACGSSEVASVAQQQITPANPVATATPAPNGISCWDSPSKQVINGGQTCLLRQTAQIGGTSSSNFIYGQSYTGVASAMSVVSLDRIKFTGQGTMGVVNATESGTILGFINYQYTNSSACNTSEGKSADLLGRKANGDVLSGYYGGCAGVMAMVTDANSMNPQPVHLCESRTGSNSADVTVQVSGVVSAAVNPPAEAGKLSCLNVTSVKFERFHCENINRQTIECPRDQVN